MNRAIVVEESLLAGLQPHIDVLIEDWKREGADQVFVLTLPRGVEDPESLRTLLRSQPNLEGAFLIGELPVARMITDPDDDGDNSAAMSDYYFMELEGDWQVSDLNIVSTADNLPPSIFVGRLFLGEDTGFQLIPDKPTELEFYQRYLEKLHTFRTTQPAARNDFKAAIANNFYGDAGPLIEWLTHLYPREDIDVHEGVTRTEYENILTGTPLDWLKLSTHGTGLGHSLDEGTNWNQSDYMVADSKVNFFEIESCSAGQTIWVDNYDPSGPTVKPYSDPIVSNILFAPTGGFVVIAPSIPFVMYSLPHFYDPLKEGGPFGKAFKLWMEQGVTEGAAASGITVGKWTTILLFGDPFIRFDVSTTPPLLYIWIIPLLLLFPLYWPLVFPPGPDPWAMQVIIFLEAISLLIASALTYRVWLQRK